MPQRKLGFSFMTNAIDLELIDQIMEHIPHWTWPTIKEEFIEVIVDSMTSDILQRLTGSPDDFDTAEEILRNHYVMPGAERELLMDTVKILGMDFVVNILDSLKLDQLQKPIDVAPCSVEPQ